jgi:hypothetical protein
MRLARLTTLALAAPLFACSAPSNPTLSVSGEVPVAEGGLRTLRAEALIDVGEDLQLRLFDFGNDDEQSGTVSVHIAPLFDEQTGTPVRVTVTNLGIGTAAVHDIPSLPNAGEETSGIPLFPCEERCATELLVTLESELDVDLEVTVTARHEHVVLGDGGLRLALFDETGAPLVSPDSADAG